jgi:ElaB/YqjD/DUF883 family membrane-anchored ribosome-binding protein
MNYQHVRSSRTQTTDVKDQLQALREDFKHLVKLIENLANDSGGALSAEVQSRLDRFASAIDQAAGDAGGRGGYFQDLFRGLFQDLGSSTRHSVEAAVRKRPLGTLALAAAAGFVLSAVVRR